jgi:Holliday junction resolvasome RuvABC endonuclease subunit
MKHYIIVGVDFSLTSPGMSALKVLEDGTFEFIDFDNCTTDSSEDWFSRLQRVQTTVAKFVWKHKPKHISVEGYSYGSTNGRETAGEVQGVSIFKLIENGFPQERIFRDISPQGRAKFATGSGRASKGEVVKAFNEAFGFSFKVKENDIVDACILAYIRYCINHYSLVEPKLNKAQKEVLDKIMNPQPKKKKTKKVKN